jgi:hypothetical protein
MGGKQDSSDFGFFLPLDQDGKNRRLQRSQCRATNCAQNIAAAKNHIDSFN